MGAQSAILDAASFGLPSATAALVLFRFVDEVLDDEEVALQTSGSTSQLLLIFLTMLKLKLERPFFSKVDTCRHSLNTMHQSSHVVTQHLLSKIRANAAERDSLTVIHQAWLCTSDNQSCHFGTGERQNFTSYTPLYSTKFCQKVEDVLKTTLYC